MPTCRWRLYFSEIGGGHRPPQQQSRYAKVTFRHGAGLGTPRACIPFDVTRTLPYRKGQPIVSQQVLHHGIQTLQRGQRGISRGVNRRGCRPCECPLFMRTLRKAFIPSGDAAVWAHGPACRQTGKETDSVISGRADTYPRSSLWPQIVRA